MADSWRVAKSLDRLLLQINAKWPTRRKSSDGSIGNAEHAARSSDHNPWVTDGDMGVVTARDFTHDPAHGFDSYAFAEHLRQTKDPRIKYVISNRHIFSSEISPWVWRAYNGSKPHDEHVHVSVSSSKPLYDSVKDWDIGDGVVPADNPPPASADRPLTRKGDTGYNVEYLQRMLGLPDTGVFDDKIEDAVIEFQKHAGLVADGKVGPYTWRALEAPAPDEPDQSTPKPTEPASTIIFSQTGRMSTFGGPKDTGMSATEGLSLFGSPAAFTKAGIGDWLLSADKAGATGLGRRLDPTKFYVACRWAYKTTPAAFLRTALIRVSNPKNNKSQVARAVDWGPNAKTGRAADLSPGLAKALGLNTNDICVVEVFGSNT